VAGERPEERRGAASEGDRAAGKTEATWSPNRPMTDAPNPQLGGDADPPYSDYINAVAADGVLYVAWADGRNGDPSGTAQHMLIRVPQSAARD
jgi:hypothetical protein